MSQVDAAADILVLDRVTKRYGSLPAVDALSLRVHPRSRHALIGPNGAGKSTLFQLVAGSLAPSSGRILFDGTDITHLPEHRRARLGISRTYQQSSVFDGLTLAGNVRLAVHRHMGVGRSIVPRRAVAAEAAHRVHELLAMVGLGPWAGMLAGHAAHGRRRQLEVALALATEPSLLLMDEPTAGMSIEESAALRELVSKVPDDLTVLIVEHDMDVVFSVATRITVLAAGRLLADGSPEEIRGSAAVQEAYLGRVDGAAERW